MLVAVLVILLLALLYKVTQRPSGFPPGVWGWPIVGYVPPRDVPLAQHLNTLRKKFGDIFTMKMGKHMAVILSDFQLIKTAFNKPELQGRPDFFTLKIFTNFKNAGIISSVGDVWQQNRRFALQHLKYFGMGKSKLESSVQREALNLLNDLEASVGIPTELTWNINMAILNVTWQLAAARSYSVDDKEILEFFKMVSVNFDIIQGPAALLDLYPWLIHIMPTFLKNSWMRVNQLDESRERIHSLLKDIIDDHCKTLDTDNPRDYIDVYLTEHLKDDTHLPALGHQDILTNTEYINLLANLSDLFVAGSETTSSTLRWACLYLALHPEVQTKIQKEIDSVVPRDTLPSLEHKEELVYLEATLREVQRKGTIVPLGVVHSATANTTLAGYSFPEGTLFMACIEGCHHDPRYWERPQDFNPDHFLDQQGKLLNKKDGFLPFSLGRRQCLGESLARMELFIFVSALLQRFTISPPPNVQLSTDSDPSKPFFNFAKPYKVILAKRG